ncbi:MAG TPA: 6-pyruvoyl-tetrahydropterin synthase-related protein, partial [Methylomirabilota bacterium]|nr:6-pyruvoyl-tetrahydropterin synthase-related protein [Methylomirabilota bacterium]
MSEGHRLARGAGLAIFFLALTAYLTWPLLPRMADGISPSPDSLLNLWALAWNYHILPREPLSLFDANIFFPRQDTLAYSEHLFGVALIAAPAYLATGNVIFAYNFAIVLSFFLSGIGMYLLVSELTGSRWAGLVSGVIYAAAPFRFLQLLHIQLLSYQWFPFVFLYLYRFLRQGRPRQLAVASVFATLQILSCNYYAMYLALALTLFAIVLILVGRSLLDRRKILSLAAAAGGVALVALPFFLPYQRNRADQGYYRRYEDVVQFSAEPLDYLRPSAFNKIFYVEY